MKSVVVITPSVGRDSLKQAIESVRDQSYRNVKHLVVADGPMYYRNVYDLVSEYSNLVQLTLCPNNTGKNGFYGHRIYAAYSHLVDQDYVVFLDEDNWFETHHIENLVNLCEEKQLDFAYSLRQVYIDGKFDCEDNCESLGKWEIFHCLGRDQKDYLIDTSTYCFRRDWLIRNCQHFHFGWGGDRRFINIVRSYANFDCTLKHTMNYSLDSNKMNANYGGIDFFRRGNAAYLSFYKGNLPWITSQSIE